MHKKVRQLMQKKGQELGRAYRITEQGGIPKNGNGQCADPIEEIAQKLNDLGRRVIFLGDEVLDSGSA